MKAKIAKLIDVKSIMTLVLTVVFCVLALTQRITGQEFLTIFTVIVGFYFGTQSQKQAAKESGTAPNETEEELPEQAVTVSQNEVTPEMEESEKQPPDEMAPVGFQY